MERVHRHTYEAFEQFVGAINALTKNIPQNYLLFWGKFLRLIRFRLKTSQVLKMLSQGMMQVNVKEHLKR